ncbi:MAG: hypothetical protein WCK02_04865 [Bacteroidota bacterium]
MKAKFYYPILLFSCMLLSSCGIVSNLNLPSEKLYSHLKKVSVPQSLEKEETRKIEQNTSVILKNEEIAIRKTTKETELQTVKNTAENYKAQISKNNQIKIKQKSTKKIKKQIEVSKKCSKINSLGAPMEILKSKTKQNNSQIMADDDGLMTFMTFLSLSILVLLVLAAGGSLIALIALIIVVIIIIVFFLWMLNEGW